MAITKRKSPSTRRKTASTATRKRKAAAKPKAKKRVSALEGPPKTKKIAGTVFKHDSCYFTKTAAAKHAETERGKGKAARVLKVGRGHCVYTRPAKR